MNAHPSTFALPDHPALLDLRSRAQWVGWRYDYRDGPDKKPRKVPMNSDRSAASDDPATWLTYERACELVSGLPCNGIGFMLHPDDGICGIDLDKCRDPDTGHLAPWAQAIVDLRETYTEVSPSGTGIHMFARGKPARAVVGGGVEIYGTGRYLTVTGNHVVGMPVAINPAPETIAALMALVAAMTPPKPEPSPAAAHDSGSGTHYGKREVSHEELREYLSHIPSNVDEPVWWKIVTAIHDETGGKGFALADEWSARGGDKYTGSKAVEDKWRRCKVGGGNGIGTIIFLARQNGADTDAIYARHNRPAGLLPEEMADTETSKENIWKQAEAKNKHQAGAAGGQAGAGGPEDEPTINLLTYKDLKDLNEAPAAFIVKGILRTKSILGIGARPGGGKTALVLEIIRCIESGEKFFGRETCPATIAYVAAEDETDVANRLEALKLDRVFIVRSAEGMPLTKAPRARQIAKAIVRKARKKFPGLPVVLIIDTLRAALGGASVLDDRISSPALNALREVAEEDDAAVIILNHTNRENPKAMKGETLEAVAATELLIQASEGDWYNLHVGKCRFGQANRKIGRMKYTSIEVGSMHAAVVTEAQIDETTSDSRKPERKVGGNQKVVWQVMQTAILDVGIPHRPYGSEGPLVKAVDEIILRDRFCERKTGMTTKGKQQAFSRALNYWLEREQLVRGETNEKALIWYGSKEGEDGEDDED